MSNGFEYGMLEKTYLKYRDELCPTMNSLQFLNYLQKRYRRSLLNIAAHQFPATVIWHNIHEVIPPDDLLGDFDPTEPVPLSGSATLDPAQYARAREFIRTKFETAEVPFEGADYCMTHIDCRRNPPLIAGRFGLYYDNILTQYALEWELKKALNNLKEAQLDSLSQPGTLPLREFVERERDPVVDGLGRCTAITVSTLVVFRRRSGVFNCLIRRRSLTVGVSPGMLHVVPAGMFEALNTGDRWSIQMNVWRELLEELYGEKELQGKNEPQLPDHILAKEPIHTLLKLIKAGSAQLSATGIVCDLLNLRPEICTILFVDDPSFAEAREMMLNWEYEPVKRAGKFAVDWTQIEEVLHRDAEAFGIVPSGAACLSLGREWVRNKHGELKKRIPMEQSADRQQDFDAFVVSAKGETSTKSFQDWAGGEQVTLAIVFTDVVGSTALGEEIRDEAMNAVRRAHFAQSRRLIEQFQGRGIKTIGDSFMAAFRCASDALDYARALQENTGHLQVRIRAGIHIGTLRVEEEDVFGGTVNFAARVVGAIKDAEIWLSERAKEDVDRLGAGKHKHLKWERHDQVIMKGFPGQFTLWAVSPMQTTAQSLGALLKSARDILLRRGFGGQVIFHLLVNGT